MTGLQCSSAFATELLHEQWMLLLAVNDLLRLVIQCYCLSMSLQDTFTQNYQGKQSVFNTAVQQQFIILLYFCFYNVVWRTTASLCFPLILVIILRKTFAFLMLHVSKNSRLFFKINIPSSCYIQSNCSQQVQGTASLQFTAARVQCCTSRKVLLYNLLLPIILLF